MEVNIVIVDDEKEIADLLSVFLNGEGYNISKFYDPIQALEYIESHEVHCALLDVMMPQMSGFDLCRKIREKYEFPILMISAKVEDSDKIIGLTYGADDYITKPFNPLEVNARVKAQLRRYLKFSKPSNNEEVLEYNGLVLNRNTHEATLYEKKIQLTPTEFNILCYLVENKGRVIGTEELFEAVWKEKYYDANNTVMVHIRRIREKMNEPAKNPKFIKTIWGVGYVVEK